MLCIEVLSISLSIIQSIFFQIIIIIITIIIIIICCPGRPQKFAVPADHRIKLKECEKEG